MLTETSSPLSATAPVFVTGGSGFVGAALIRDLAARGLRVRALARSDAAADAVRAAGAAEVVRGDLDDLPALLAGVTGCAAVIHSAAVMQFAGAGTAMQRVNVEGTRQLLAAANQARVPRFVALGAAAVYARGQPQQGVREETPLPDKPLGAYAATKLEAGALVLAANRPGFATMLVTPPAVWGAGDPFLLPQLVRAVKRGRFVWIDGGRYPFSFCHVRNVCEGVWCALQRGRGGEQYLIADAGPTPTFRELMTGLVRSQGLDPGSRSVPRGLILSLLWLIELVSRLLRRTPPVSRDAVAMIAGAFTLDDGKARRELGYAGQMSRDDGFAELKARSIRPGHSTSTGAPK